jgi:hypothetical protein
MVPAVQRLLKKGARDLARLCLPCCLLLAACRKNEAPAPAPGDSAALPLPSASPSARAPKQTPLPDERVEIPTGSFRAGSVPGEAGRNPELEPRLSKIELGGFQIDRLPYPNDPAKPPLRNVSFEEAKRLCAERGARLCSELEWERACKGPDSDPYPSGPEWDERCSKDLLACATGFDVLGMGTTAGEWTASQRGSLEKRVSLVRGAAASAPAAEHRCAARHPTPPTERSESLGFRCCWGAPNAKSLEEPKAGETFKKTKLTAERLSALLLASPETKELAKDVKFFRDPDSAETVVSRGPGDRKGFSFTVAPLLWNPTAGAEFLLVTARSGDSTSFVLAYYVRGDDDYGLAASFVMKDEPGPVAFAYSNDIRPRLHFSTCWGCRGETGKILFRPPERVAILQP